MKLQIISDIHLNTWDNCFKDNKFKFKKIPLFIAGDLSHNSEDEIEFLQELNTDIFFVAGNHLGYDYYKHRLMLSLFGINEPLSHTKEDHIKRLNKFSKQFNNIHFLNDTYIEYNNYIIYGGTMFTDFKLYGQKHIDDCKNVSLQWMNDFHNVYTFDKKKNIVRPLMCEDYEKYFKKFMNGLKKCIKETNKDIIVLTHFAPSINSISKEYLHAKLTKEHADYHINACYACNLNSFIIDNPRIKLWIHGHVHSAFDYNIGQCRVVCNSYGYPREQTLKPNEFKIKIITI